MLKRLAIAATAALLMGAGPAAADHYTINGAPASPRETAALAAMGVPPGHYWLAPDGRWGIVGSDVPLGTFDLRETEPRNGAGPEPETGNPRAGAIWPA